MLTAQSQVYRFRLFATSSKPVYLEELQEKRDDFLEPFRVSRRASSAFKSAENSFEFVCKTW